MMKFFEVVRAVVESRVKPMGGGRRATYRYGARRGGGVRNQERGRRNPRQNRILPGAMRALVVACGRWAEAPAERLKEAARTGAVFEALIAPVIKDCVWGEIQWSDGVAAGSEKSLAERIRAFYRG